MSKAEAHKVLDRWKAGESFSPALIDICLAITGDLSGRL